MKEFSFLIRKISIPPVFAACLLTLTFILRRQYIGAPWHLAIGLISLAVLPTLAYPLQRFIKGYKDRGREGQRTLAMIFSFVGYLVAVASALILPSPEELKLIYLEYLLCGISILVFNNGFHLKASGHACGIVGPVLLALRFRMFIPSAVGALLVVPVFYASLSTKRHTAWQLVGGASISGICLAFLCLAFALWG